MRRLNFILTSDDVGRDSIKNFDKFVSLLEMYDIKATFFAVPKPRDNLQLNKNKEWISALREAIKKGHDVQLHGYEHSRFECGIPTKFILSLYGDRKNEVIHEYKIRKKEIEKNLEINRLTRKLSDSKKIFEEVMGYSPICFRSPLLSSHENLYKVLKKLEIKYSSNLVITPDGWNYIKNSWKQKEKYDLLPVATKTKEGIIELPISCEYSWFLGKNDFDRALKLMKDDAEKISKIKNSFMMPLSHFYAVIKNPAGERLYKEFFDYAKSNFDFKSYTIKDYVTQVMD